MNKRKITISIILGIVGFGLIWLIASPSKETEKDLQTSSSAKYPVFDVLQVQNTQPRTKIEITGRILPIEHLDLYAKVSGQLRKGTKPFKEGIVFKKGETIIQLDDRSFRLDLVSQRSNLLSSLLQIMPDIRMDFPGQAKPWDDYLAAFDIEANLRPLPPVEEEKLKYFLAAQGIYNQFYAIKSLQSDADDYRIRAPFHGVLSEVYVNPGMQVNTQTQLGSFASTEAYELQSAVSLPDLKYLHVGDQVSLTSQTLDQSWKGTIQRISKTIDQTNQQVRVFLEVKGEGLKEGLFLEGVIGSQAELNHKVAVLPMETVVRQSHVYVVKDSLIESRPVKPLRYAKDEVWVTGLQDGEYVIQSPGSEPLHGIKAIAKAN